MDLPWIKEKGYSVRGCYFLSLRRYTTHFYQLEKCCCCLQSNCGGAATLILPDLEGHIHEGKMIGKKKNLCKKKTTVRTTERDQEINQHKMLLSSDLGAEAVHWRFWDGQLLHQREKRKCFCLPQEPEGKVKAIKSPSEGAETALLRGCGSGFSCRVLWVCPTPNRG